MKRNEREELMKECDEVRGWFIVKDGIYIISLHYSW